ncbi:MAG: MAPEG family protein, partial [Alphaproteobacteria bacterium]|nr:MAPEG family protein [Alphaproteobacteria bacterium]
YTPFVVILMGLIEMARGSSTWLWLVALAYIVGRVLHAFGMDKDFASKLRGAGIMISWLTLISLAVVALYSAYTSPQPALPSMMGVHV